MSAETTMGSSAPGAELDASPEQVWDAIATGPGISSWFMGPHEIEPRVGGKITLTTGDFSEQATITAWDPSKRHGPRLGQIPAHPCPVLMYFTGRPGTFVYVEGPETDQGQDAWTRLTEGLGLTSPVSCGDRVRLTPEGLAPIEGVVDYVVPGHQEFLGSAGATGCTGSTVAATRSVWHTTSSPRTPAATRP